MTFMKKQIIRDRAYQVETTHGTEIVPFHIVGVSEYFLSDHLQPYCEGKVRLGQKIERLPLGYVYRLSAPGYLDCTPWGYASTEPMATISLRELYGEHGDEDTEID